MKPITSLASTLFLFAALISGGCGGGGGGGGTNGSGSDVTGSLSGDLTPLTPEGQATSPYEVTVLGTLGGDSYAVALNNAGQVVGNYLGEGGATNAFIWEGGRMTALADSAQAADINDRGQVVGWLEQADGPEAFFFDKGLFRVNTLEGSSKALAVDNRGRVAGRRTTSREYAFIEDGQMESIAPNINGYAVAMNDSGQVIIKQVLQGSFHALLWENGAVTDLGTLGGGSTQVKGINAAGLVVGASQVAGGAYHAFLWEQGHMRDLGTFGGDSSSAVAINAKGQILIKSSGVDGDRFLLWQDGDATSLGNFGADYAEAMDLNDQGQIVGWLMLDSGEIRAFLATPNNQG